MNQQTPIVLPLAVNQHTEKSECVAMTSSSSEHPVGVQDSIPKRSFWDSDEFGDFNAWCSSHELEEIKQQDPAASPSEASSPVSVNLKILKKKNKIIEPPICLQNVKATTTSSTTTAKPATDLPDSVAAKERSERRAERRRKRKLLRKSTSFSSKSTSFSSKSTLDDVFASSPTRTSSGDSLIKTTAEAKATETRKNRPGMFKSLSFRGFNAAPNPSAKNNPNSFALPDKISTASQESSANDDSSLLTTTTAPEIPQTKSSKIHRIPRSLSGNNSTAGSSKLKSKKSTSSKRNKDVPATPSSGENRPGLFKTLSLRSLASPSPKQTTEIPTSSSGGNRAGLFKTRSLRSLSSPSPKQMTTQSKDMSTPSSGGNRPGLFKARSLRSLSLTRKPKDSDSVASEANNHKELSLPPFASPPTTMKITAASPGKRSLLMKSLSFRGRNSNTSVDDAAKIGDSTLPPTTPMVQTLPTSSRRSLLGRSQSLRVVSKAATSDASSRDVASPLTRSPSFTSPTKTTAVSRHSGLPTPPITPNAGAMSYETPSRVTRSLSSTGRRRRGLRDLPNLHDTTNQASPPKTPGLDRWSCHDKIERSSSFKNQKVHKSSPLDAKRKMLLERNLMERSESMSKLLSRQSSSRSLKSVSDQEGGKDKSDEKEEVMTKLRKSRFAAKAKIEKAKAKMAKKSGNVGRSDNDDDSKDNIVNVADLFPDAGWGWTSTTPVVEIQNDVVITTCVRDDLSSRKSSTDDDCDLLDDDDSDNEFDELINKYSSDRAAAMYLMSSTTVNEP